MDIRSLTPEQLHTLDLAAAGRFLAILHEAMIMGDYVDCDAALDFAGAGYIIDFVFGGGRDGYVGRMTRLLVEDAHALPEPVRLGILLLQVSCFQVAMAERRRRSEARVEKILEERATRAVQAR